MRQSAIVVILALAAGIFFGACSGKPCEEDLFKQAQSFAQEQKYELAANTYETLLTQYPNSDKAANIQFTLGSTYAMFDTSKARAAYQKFIDAYGANVDPYMLESAKFELNNLGRDLDEVINFDVIQEEESAEATPAK